ncbi:MAG: BsuPI-related putative proteinase inhibitor [Gemmatimonadota bacterium]|nr:BsuPI-related putative proteinase inhibitor [Gemmatimonadota bacterium]
MPTSLNVPRRKKGRPGRGVALVAAVLAIGCSGPRGSDREPASGDRGPVANPGDDLEETIVTDNELRLTLSVPGGAPPADRPFELVLAVRNEDDAPAVLDFPDGQRYDFHIHDADGEVVWHWAGEMMFTMMIGRETLPPEGEIRWSEEAPGLPAGSYRVLGTLTTMEPRTAELRFEVTGGR